MKQKSFLVACRQTCLLGVLFSVLHYCYGTIESPTVGSINAQTINDGVANFALARAMADGLVLKAGLVVFVVLMVFVWKPVFVNKNS